MSKFINIDQLSTSLRTTKEYVDNKIDNIKVGARNLLWNSSFRKEFPHNDWGTNDLSIISFVTEDGEECCKIDMPSPPGPTEYIAIDIAPVLIPGETYTVSGWVKSENITEGTTDFCAMFYIDGTYHVDGVSTWFGLGHKGFTVNTSEGEWEHVAYTFIAKEEYLKTATSCLFYVYVRFVRVFR